MDQFSSPTILADGLAVLRADNPSEMTLDGTNTYLLFDPSIDRLSPCTPVVLVDPGPELEEHLQALAVFDVRLVLITHRHWDHTQGIDRLVELTNAPVRARLADYCRDAEVFTDREVIEAAGARVRVEFTPGHTSDSVCFVVLGDTERLLTGDTVLGRGTTILEFPDGTLRDYLDSLDRLLNLEDMPLHPAHGPQHEHSHRLLEAYVQHREDRLNQVRGALDAKKLSAADAQPQDLLDAVYPDLDPRLASAATHSLQAQLHYLAGSL